MTSTMISRRNFLKSSSALATAGVLPGLLVTRDLHAASRPTTLVSIHLTGGNDTLNMIVPYTDAEYYRLRGPLGISKSDVHPLDERLGLNPGMGPFATLFKRKQMAIVHGVGYPSFNYSHFEAGKIYTTGDPSRNVGSGWLGRALDAAVAQQTSGSASELTGAAVGNVPGLAANFVAPVLPQDPETYIVSAQTALQKQALGSVITQPTLADAPGAFNTIARAGQSAWKTVATVAEASNLTTSVPYPAGDFAARLRFTAQLLRADDTVRVVGLTQGNYDTHENQRVRHEAQLAELTDGVSAFMTDLEAHGISDRVVVFLWSEFSRRVRPNGNGGTDHGAAQAVVLIGDGVRSGFVGHTPGLSDPDDVDGSNIRMQVDFRQVYATLLDGWLGLDSKKVLAKSWGSLPLLL